MRKVLFTIFAIFLIFSTANAKILTVPDRYSTIAAAIEAAADGDTILVRPGVYTLPASDQPGDADYPYQFEGLKFAGKSNIKLTSMFNPDSPNWDVVTQTVIDCGGGETYEAYLGGIAGAVTDATGVVDEAYVDATAGTWRVFESRRAFYFDGTETNIEIIGFTIRNGVTAGAVGQYGNAQIVDFEQIVEEGEEIPAPTEFLWRVSSGLDAEGDGYGGAVLCENDASPKFRYCHFANNTVMGGRGGNGADGQGFGAGELNAEWGGHGGHGSGFGYGGAVAARNTSTPEFDNCIFEGNVAKGGEGGNGGNGGDQTGDGQVGGGGNGGYGGAKTMDGMTYGEGGVDPQGAPQLPVDTFAGDGEGFGGAIWVEYGSAPTITNCTFLDNEATNGRGGDAGSRGLGDDRGDDALASRVGDVGSNDSSNDMLGAAIFYSGDSDAGAKQAVSISNSQFELNRTYEEQIFAGYGLGGDTAFILEPEENDYSNATVYIEDMIGMTMDNCRFFENVCGAVEVINSDLTLNTCDFIANEAGRGAAIEFRSSEVLSINDSSFSGNIASGDGGAIWAFSAVYISDSSFSDNISEGGLGGGIYSRAGWPLDIDMTTFVGNKAVWGGAIFVDQATSDVHIDKCYFQDNTAESAGAIYLLDSTDNTVDQCTFLQNHAIGGDFDNVGGGAIVCSAAALDLKNSIFRANDATNEQGYGGAINLFGGDNDPSFHTIFNCLFESNKADQDGGAIISQFWTEPDIANCTFAYNTSGDLGGAVYQGWGLSGHPAVVRDSIFYKNSKYALYEENFGGQIVSSFNLFYQNTPADFYKSDTGDFAGDAGQAGFDNEIGDPRFENGPLGAYYLQQAYSPAVDNGSQAASNVFTSSFTTSKDNIADTGQVDQGYHHLNSDDPLVLPSYTLNVQVDPLTPYGKFKISGSVYGPSNPFPATQYPLGTYVPITAIPDAGFRVGRWSGGTSNDSSTKNDNGVLVSSDKTITISFEQPDFIYVGGDSQIKDIQEGINNAKDGDVVVIQSGIWHTERAIILDKSIRLTSDSPENPERTVINGNEVGNSAQWKALVITGAADEDTIVEGLTFSEWRGSGANGRDGENAGDNGVNGASVSGIVITIDGMVSPTLRNCVIEDSLLRAGNGGTGADGDDETNAGRGGWGGFIRGGGIYIGRNAAPVFENIEFRNLEAVGGMGGDGGNEGHPSTFANYGGNWSISQTFNVTRDSVVWVEGDLWAEWGYAGPARYYTGYGGAVYCDQSSSPTFINCTFEENTAWGGRTGLGGEDSNGFRAFPTYRYELPSFGGAVYCAENTNVLFQGCTFENNSSVLPGHGAPPSQPDDFWATPEYLDFYIGHGGGVCAETECVLTFEDCDFIGNEASLGGALYYNDTCDVALSNCRFEENEAFNGGAIQGVNSKSFFNATTFKSNRATLQPGTVGEEVANEEENVIFGQGGALALFGTPTDFIDCVFTENLATAEGGALYFKGSSSETIIESNLFNCLLDNNYVGGAGGAIASSWFSQVTLDSCTVADNGAYWNTGQGGGLSANLNSSIDTIDTIIWGNLASNGSQLYVGDGLDGHPEPSSMKLDFSNVQTEADDILVQPNLTVAATGTPSILVETILGEGISIIGDPVYTGNAMASGTFKGGISAGIGIEEGIIMTTGTATDALGPNSSDGTSTFNNEPGDEDLDALLPGGVTSQDATVLTFTFRSDGGDLFFNFVFASEEYNEFTNSSFNDVFAFLLDGENIALIPGTNVPVTINNVNGGNPIGINASNEELFNNNDLTDGGPFHYIEYDGFTQVFTAQKFGLGAGTHTIKLAIADASDQALDSAVFIQAKSFSDTPTIPFGDPVIVETNSSIEGFAQDEQTMDWQPEPGSGNISASPEFIQGNLGAYYLSQEDVDPNQPQSNAVDKGSMLSGFGGDYTTRTDNLADVSVVDMGFHYPTRGFETFDICQRCDLLGIFDPNYYAPDALVKFEYDGIVNMNDLSLFAYYWLDADNVCGPANGWCAGADVIYDINKRVDMLDILTLAGCWLVQDTEVPVPNPSEWAPGGGIPTSDTETSIVMTAATSRDNWDDQVEYYFDCVVGDCIDSGWQVDSHYENTGLLANELYSYRVRVRDNAGNMTDWSDEIFVTTGADATPPEPLKAEFSILPNSTSLTSVAMEALEAIDPSGVEYNFLCVSGNCNDSGWQDSTTYEDTGLMEGDSLQYAVIYRDKSPFQNQGELSDYASVIVGADIDETPPAPDPMTFAIAPASSGCEEITMTATVATDASEPVEYFFENTTDLTDSGWIESPTWTQGGLTIGVEYSYRVMARDSKGNMTAFSEEASAIVGDGIDCLPPYPSGGVQGQPATFALGGQPDQYQISGQWYHSMVALEAEDESAVEYIFECRGSNCVQARVQQESPIYVVPVASQNFNNEYRVIYIDVFGNESAPSAWYEVIP